MRPIKWTAWEKFVLEEAYASLSGVPDIVSYAEIAYVSGLTWLKVAEYFDDRNGALTLLYFMTNA